MKKILSILLALAMLLTFAACGGTEVDSDSESDSSVDVSDESVSDTVADEVSVDPDYKVGFIFLHDENSTYDKNFMDAAKAVQAELGLSDEQVLFKVGIPESNECYEAAAELVDEGCDLIFADSFGHETYMIQAAEEFPEVQFAHATGTKSQTEGLDNYHNAFASIYEGRYLAGVAAGMKLNEMIENGEITPEEAKIGYVGAFNYAEVVSGLTSFFLGARSICESATMEVVYTNSWFDIALEKEAAITLMDSGCVLISQHADSEGAPKACEERGVPNVAYNISTISIAPTTALISSKIDWAPYMKMIVEATMKGENFETDWCGSLETNSVLLTELNEAVAAEGTAEKIEEVKAGLLDGSIKVFDTSKFTVNGETLTEYLADVVDEGDFVPETNVIADGAFNESSLRSAPYFDIKYIDGITAK
ncbi:MAG: BMP family ABC transporter substrate-binding protein [Clostridia bacterium]|nr:BMP family ABC transporter substrate-binding protein [Clostridia bacterium]